MATTSEEETIMEERHELMLSSPKLHPPKRRLARFLKPSLIVQPFSYNPPTPTTLSSLPKITSSNLSFKFNGFRTLQNDWNSWVLRMHSLHQSTWKQAGIHNAILNSTYEITKNDNLILGLAEKWCHDTNTFVFTWGEATITLQDMMVLGGYSVLGESLLNPVQNQDSLTSLTKLNQAWLEFSRSRAKKADQGPWLKRFKDDNESGIEHEAFLVLWLSRFVLPSSYTTVVKNVFPIAVRLARGIKIALAPAVLATIYRDLSMLKYEIVYSIDDDDDDPNDATFVTVFAPLQLVQIWIYERLFPNKLNQSVCNADEPRFARWDNKNLQIENVGSLLDCDIQKFRWQPYEIDDLFSCKAYRENERWVVDGDGLDEELESWVRCLRVSELVGLDPNCIEPYLPHRVAMQFGMDQDVPGEMLRMDATSDIAWGFYSRPVRDVVVYLPSKLCEPCVTVRYLEWWNESVWVEARSPVMGDDEPLKKFESRNESERSKDGTRTSDEANTLGLELEARIRKVEEVFVQLEARIRNVEEVFVHLKAKKLGHKTNPSKSLNRRSKNFNTGIDKNDHRENSDKPVVAFVEEFKLLESSRNSATKSIGVNVKDDEVSKKTELQWKVTDDIGVVEVDSGHHSIGGVNKDGAQNTPS
ncbi:hypothetical protein L6452_00040 [Arctium lappa]|uniref:Uncharacterized protein n=1 Tax=Arctium lappa TaxID=4217 RepID=A0ACB9FCB9_ARCLA|nr:hypothetical protein L6452_00040 [Arctium lappa]